MHLKPTATRHWLGLVGACAAIALLVAPLSPAHAQADGLAWERFDVEATLLPDGNLQVVETQTINFSGRTYSEGFARIPLLRTDGVFGVSVGENGQAYRLTETGASNTYQVEVDDLWADVVWYFPPTQGERRTFTLSYTLRRAVWRDPGGDQLTFTAVSQLLDDPVYASVVTLHLPRPLVQEPDSIGAKVEWETSSDGMTVIYTAKGGVRPRQGMAVDLFFEHDPEAAKPEWQLDAEAVDALEAQIAETLRLERERRALLQAQLNLASGAIFLALLLVVPGALYAVWYTLGRDAPAGVAPDHLPESPSDLPPGLVGVLVDEQADLRDMSATIIDLARRGHLTIEDSGGNTQFKSPRSLTLRRASEKRPEGLRQYEGLIYDGLFNHREVAEFADLPYGFRAALPQIEAAMYSEAVSEGLFRSSPGEARKRFRNLGLGVMATAVALGFIAALVWGSLTLAVIFPALPVVGFGAGLLWLGPHMPARTRKGAEQAGRWRAFQKYLGNLKHYGDVAGVAAKFDAYLPYAVMFGLERRWVQAFTSDSETAKSLAAPRWYRALPDSKVQGAPRQQPGTPASPRNAGAATSGAAALDAATSNAATGSATPAVALNLNSVGQGVAASLNELGQGFASALNTVGESMQSGLATGGPSAAAGGGSWGGSSRTASAGGFRGGSGSRGSFRSSRGVSGGGSTFRSGGSFGRSSGGGRRGFR